MSRNPYLASATRPTSSFTRSSRTSSRRNDLPSSCLGSALGRSRSSATLSGLSSGATGSSYTSPSSYTPSSSTWQRSLSSTRSSRTGNDPSTVYSSSYRANEYTPSSQSDGKPKSYETSETSLRKSTSSHNFGQRNDNEDDEDTKSAAISSVLFHFRFLVKLDNSNPIIIRTLMLTPILLHPRLMNQLQHLKNYQQSKLSQPHPQMKTRSSIQSLGSEDSADTRQSVSSLDSTTDLTFDGSESISSSSAPKHLKQVQLTKSRSLEISQIPQPDPASVLPSSMSVDRLLLRSESMTERELRKSYKELVIENEQLRKQLKGVDDREKQKQQDWIRKERQMQRKISELEEESRQLEQWKQEIQHLKEENSSLIRVVTKLSKKN